MFRKIFALAAVPAVAVALTFASGAANASVASKPDGVAGITLNTTDGEAGYYTQAFGTTFTQANATFDLLPAAQNLGAWNGSFPPSSTAGAIGTQACDSSNGDAAQIGVLENGTGVNGGPGTYTVAIGYGTLTGAGVGGDPCVGNGILTSGSLTEIATQLTAVPAGDSVQVQIQAVDHGHAHGVLFTAADSHDGVEVTSYSKWISTGFNHFNEVGDGVQQDPALVVACGSACGTDLVDFSGVTATTGGTTEGLANWNAVQVDSANLGSVFVSPNSSITPTTGSVTTCKIIRVKDRHRYHGKIYRYKNEKVCTTTGGGPSSFSVSTGSPTGV
jgi:hypothetical protein